MQATLANETRYRQRFPQPVQFRVPPFDRVTRSGPPPGVDMRRRREPHSTASHPHRPSFPVIHVMVLSERSRSDTEVAQQLDVRLHAPLLFDQRPMEVLAYREVTRTPALRGLPGL